MKSKIVIIEDDAALDDILSILLRRNGYQVEEYISGEPMIHDVIECPDLFLLDKKLSDVDGLDICRYLKHQATTSNIPVIILSATPNLQKQVQEAGADAFIEKPFTSRILLSTIARLIQVNRHY